MTACSGELAGSTLDETSGNIPTRWGWPGPCEPSSTGRQPSKSRRQSSRKRQPEFESKAPGTVGTGMLIEGVQNPEVSPSSAPAILRYNGVFLIGARLHLFFPNFRSNQNSP